MDIGTNRLIEKMKSREDVNLGLGLELGMWGEGVEVDRIIHQLRPKINNLYSYSSYNIEAV